MESRTKFVGKIDFVLEMINPSLSIWKKNGHFYTRERIMRLVLVFILETNNQANNECLPKFVQTDNASSSIKTAIMYDCVSCNFVSQSSQHP